MAAADTKIGKKPKGRKSSTKPANPRTRRAKPSSPAPNTEKPDGAKLQKPLVEESTPEKLASLPLRAIVQEAIAPEDQWLSSKVVAAMLGVSEKWLSAAREGLKGIEGPPYKKLGSGRTAPVRYNLGALRDWLARFPSQINTHGATVSKFTSAAEFFNSKDSTAPWLFAEVDGELVDFFVALNQGLLRQGNEPRLRWLNFWDWLKYSASTPRMEVVVTSAISSIKARALSLHQEDLLGTTIRNPADATKKPKKHLGDKRS